jgi:DNA polymerase I-like protein with 3'-5' exonuclease and polymerase domains
MTVHDEIVVMVRKEIVEKGKEFVSQCMIEAAKTFIKDIPVEVKVVDLPHWSK